MSTPLDINSTTPRIEYLATASQTAFAVPFEFFANADLTVRVNNGLKALDSDYTVTGAEVVGGGTVTFTTGLAANDEVSIYTDIEYARDVQYTQSGNLPHNVLERDFAKIIRQMQQLERERGRSVHLAEADFSLGVNMELPTAASRADKYLHFTAATGAPEAVDAISATTTLSAAVIGGYLYPRTQAETDAGIDAYDAGNTIGDIMAPQYPAGDIRRYGAATATADNTVAIQASINQCSHSGANVWVPVGQFTHLSSLWYYYDASNNPGFLAFVDDSTEWKQGNITVEGERATTYQTWKNIPGRGPNLYFNPASGAGIGHKVGNDDNGQQRGYRFKSLTISGDTSDEILYFTGTSIKAGLFDCAVYQESTGTAIRAQDVWDFVVELTHCRTSHTGNLGYGIRIESPNNGAGNYWLEKCNFKAFKYNGSIGLYDYAGGVNYTMQTVSVVECEFGGTSPEGVSTTGLRIGEHTTSLILEQLYFEKCETLLDIVAQHSNIMIRGGNYAAYDCTTAAIVLGDGAGVVGDRQHTTVIEGLDMHGLPANKSYIERHVANTTGPLMVRHCNAQPATATGTKFLEITGDGAGVSMDYNNLYGSPLFANEYAVSGSGEIDFYRSGNRIDGTLGESFTKGVRDVGVKQYTVADTTGNLDVTYRVHKINTSGGATALTLPNGIAIGQRVTIFVPTYGSEFTLTVTSRVSPLLGTVVFNSASDLLDAMWDGVAWRETHNTSLTYS